MKKAIDDNTVSADNQVVKSASSYVLGNTESGTKIAVLGNSITRHGPNPGIGWNNDFGMAASDRDHDYVHLLFNKLAESGKDVCFFVKQFAFWERNLTAEFNEDFSDVMDFKPDIIVFRLGENVARNVDLDLFERETERLLDYVGGGRARLLLTTCFWHHEAVDTVIRRLSEKRGLTPVELGDLGDRPEMKALGLFEHSGVASHPGDLGMENIAERIFDALVKML